MSATFSTIQKQIDSLISLFGGTQNLSDFFNFVITGSKKNEQNKSEGSDIVISNLIILSVYTYFSITRDDLLNTGKGGKSLSNERRIAYKLHKDFCQLSTRKIGKIFNRKESAVFNAIVRMEEIIEDPNRDLETYESYLYIKKIVNYVFTKKNKDQAEI